MYEELTINNQQYISYDLLSNVDQLMGHANIDHLQKQYPEMPTVNSNLLTSSTLNINDDIFLEQDNMENKAIWLKKNSAVEKQIGECLENEPLLNHQQYEQTLNRLIQQEADTRHSSLNDFINQLPKSKQDKLQHAMTQNNDVFPWKSVIESIISDEDEFSVKSYNGSSEVAVIFQPTQEHKQLVEEAVEQASDAILEHNKPKHQSRRKNAP